MDADRAKHNEINAMLADYVKIQLHGQAQLRRELARPFFRRSLFIGARVLWLWLVIVMPIVLGGAFVIWRLGTPRPRSTVGYQEVERLLERHQVRRAFINAGAIGADTTDGRAVRAQIPDAMATTVWADLIKSKAIVTAAEPINPWAILAGCLGIGLLLLVSQGIYRSLAHQPSPVLSFAKSRARVLSSLQKKHTFKDFVSSPRVQEQTQRMVDFLREPQRYQKLGAHIPEHVLLVGPPGCGKTHLGRVIAGEANVPLLSSSGSDFVELFPGVGAARIRDLFEEGRRNAPCFVFIDDLDAIGRQRTRDPDPLSLEREVTLNQLLVAMDGLQTSEGVIVLAATNRPDLLDEALLEEGRFGVVLELDYPTKEESKELFRVYTKKVPLAEDIDFQSLVDQLGKSIPKATGATIKQIVNGAAVLAAEGGGKVVEHEHFLRSISDHNASIDAAKGRVKPS